MYQSPEFKQYITETTLLALAEDLGSSDGVDITAELIPAVTKAQATLISREPTIVCGKAWVEEVFRQLAPTTELQWHVEEGEQVSANTKLLDIEGSARAILTAERTAMNFLQSLSGTATTVSTYVEQIKDTHCQLLDTRKTIPGLRMAQKYAVTVGGGYNHRIGLFDAFLIKENHIATCGGITAAITLARKNHPNRKVEVETENFTELTEALDVGADVIMLDNFSIEDMKKAVEMAKLHQNAVKLEASGNITDDELAAVAATGVDFISVGALTKHIRAIDLSMRVALLAE
ncbi:carboxylating nicotinate-nucleotide diphosphorylase [Pleionea sp. CnH1-48]|uniref:carboxylating nicotinate-nucleotide diphosphorylase n=1 Tax=Pleionea sp. CnH1-48 TaxID=2954494 RepID=UPI0020972BD3|nr:carboxylating nicotinate-nucleotide diphosphorylase [Pleionea sp. CnH1-48]MCO7223971.1 carboxylating nicotinate-nucleotide diphosphorylase [Pleionea sp. CnH1-48]